MDFTIRMATPQDAPALLSIYAPYVTETNITFEYEVPSEADFESRIVNVLQKLPYLVAEREGELLGYVYASPYKGRAAYAWSVETSVYIRQDCRISGLGSALYERLEELLRRQNIVSVNACVTHPNEPSERFHVHCGYHQVAHFESVGFKHGKWIDTLWFQKFLCPLPAQPRLFIPITELPL